MDVPAFFRNKSVSIEGYKAYEGFLKLTFKELVVYGCYVSPNINETMYKTKINELMEDANKETKDRIILGDLNAKSPL